MVLEVSDTEEVGCTDKIVLEVSRIEELGCTDRIVLDVYTTGSVEETYTIVLYALCEVDGITTTTEDDDWPETSVLDDATNGKVEEG